MKSLHKRGILIFVIILFFGLVLPFNTVNAECGGICKTVTSVIGGFATLIIFVLGGILTLLIKLLLLIASYNGHISAQPVQDGWVIVRDIANLFFSVIILIIAFATILQSESYTIKKTLPTLLIMAILVNFSKTIAGIFIDASQVVTLTFVNSFASSGAFSFQNLLAIGSYMKIDPNTSGGIAIVNIVGAYLLAIVYMIIATSVIGVLLAVFVQRTIMLWILVILSPMPYILSIIPAGKKYAEQWWSEFGKYCVNVPVLSFFLWLSLSMFASSGDAGAKAINDQASAARVADDAATTEAQAKLKSDNAGATEASKPNAMLSFIIGIAMLMGSLQVASTIGGMAGKAAGDMYAKGVDGILKDSPITKGAGAATKWAARKAAGSERLKGWAKGDGKGATAAAFAQMGLAAVMNPKKAWENVKASFHKDKDHQEDEVYGNILGGGLDKGGIRGLASGVFGGDIAPNIKGWFGKDTNWAKQSDINKAGKELDDAIKDGDTVSTYRSLVQQGFNPTDSATRVKIQGDKDSVDTNLTKKQRLLSSISKIPGSATLAEKINEEINVLAGESKTLGDKLTAGDNAGKMLNDQEVKQKKLKDGGMEGSEEYKRGESLITDMVAQSMTSDVGFNAWRSKDGVKGKEIEHKKAALTEVRKRELITYNADIKMRKLDSEESALIAGITDGGEIVNMFNRGMSEDNHSKIRAVLLQAAKTGSIDDIALNLGLNSNDLSGIYKEIEKRTGMGGQIALRNQLDVGETAKRANHLQVAHSVEMKHGHYQQADPLAQSKAIASDIAKIGSQTLLRDGGRKNWGEEQKDANGNLEFKINESALQSVFLGKHLIYWVNKFTDVQPINATRLRTSLKAITQLVGLIEDKDTTDVDKTLLKGLLYNLKGLSTKNVTGDENKIQDVLKKYAVKVKKDLS